MNEENLIKYYNKFNEDKRLNSRHGQVEFITSLKYIHEYLENLQPFCEGELGQLQKTSYEKEVPIIPKDVVQFLGVVLSIIKPKKILEIGMAVGFSASYMTGFLQFDYY